MRKLTNWLENQSLGRHMGILGLGSVLTTGLVFVILVVFVLLQFSSYNANEHLRFQSAVDYSIDSEQSQQRNTTADYAIWDDMVTAVETQDTAWFDATFLGTLANFDLKGIWIIRGGQKLYAQRAEGFERLMPPTDLDLPAMTAEHAVFDRYEDKIMRFQYVAIVPHHEATPAAQPSYLVTAKQWDEKIISHLATVTQSRVQFSSAIRPRDSIYSMQVSRSLPTPPESLGAILIDYQRDNYILILFVRSVTLALILFVLVIIPMTVLNIVLQNRWVIAPLSSIRAQILQHTSLFAGTGSSTQNELKILSSLTDSYIAQEQQAISSSQQLAKQTEELSAANEKIKEELLHHERLSLVVEKSTNGVLITDAEKQIIYVNPSWEKLNGYTQAEVLGKTPSVVKSGKTPSAVYEKMWQALTAGKSFTTEELVNRRKDGKEWECRLSVYPIQQENKTLNYVGIQQNISKQKEVDRMKTDFISLASHQLRTPLSAMRWFSELLLKGNLAGLSTDQQDLIGNLYKSTLRMIALVNMLLNISRIESGRLMIDPVDTDLRQMCDEILAELTPRLNEKKITASKYYQEGLPMIKVDPHLIREVFVNLLTNALKYSKEQSTIDIRIERIGEEIHVSVADKGIGIPTDDQDKIFLKFFRGSNVMSTETDGTGLGLYFVKEIVETSGGRIWFESHEGQGTTFFVSLPMRGSSGHQGEVSISPMDTV